MLAGDRSLSRSSRYALATAGIVVTIAAWYLASLYDVQGLGPPIRPDRVVLRALKLLQERDFQSDVSATVSKVLLAAGIGSIAGAIWGLLIGVVSVVDEMTRPVFYTAQSIPIIVLGMLFLLILGPTAIQAISFVSFIVFIQTAPIIAASVASTEWNYIRIAKATGLGSVGTIFKVIIPRVAPDLLSSLRSSLVVAWSFVAFAETLGGEYGMGLRIMELRRFNHSTELFAYVLVITFCVVAGDIVLRGLRRGLFPWVRT